MIGFWSDILNDMPPEAKDVECWDERAWWMLLLVGVCILAILRWWK
jgi:hypothetical protein